MAILDRYILRHVLGAILLVLLVLGGLDMLFTLFDEMGDTSESYGIMDAAWYVLLTLPRHLYELLPLSSLIGALVGLGALAGSNELMVMQVSGVSVSRIVWAVMKPAVLITLLALFVGEFVAPGLEMHAEVTRAIVRGEEQLVSRSGYWLRDGRRYLHANAIGADGELLGLTVYLFSEELLPEANLVADSAAWQGVSNGGNRWRLNNVRQLEFRQGADFGLLAGAQALDSMDLVLELSPALMDVLVMDPQNMPVSDLYRYAGYFRGQQQDAGQYYLAFWKKVLQPLTTVSLVLVAISFIFGPLRSATMGSRLFTAICFGLGFVLLQRMLGIATLVYQSDPLTAVVLPILLSAGLGAYLLRRAA